MEHRALQLVEKITRHRDFESIEEHFLSNLSQLFPVLEIKLNYFGEEDSGLIVDREVSGTLDPNENRIREWRVSSPLTPLNQRQITCLEKSSPLAFKDPAMDKYGLYFPLEDEKHNTFSIVAIYALDDLSDKIPTFEAITKIYRNYLTVIRESETDQLTGLLNRKTFEIKFNRLVELQHQNSLISGDHHCINQKRRNHNGEPSWLAILDIDFFKSVNDTYGHIIGDEILILVSRLMQKSFRRDDLLFRFGGEEFVILLSPTTGKEALMVLERFRKKIEEYDFPQVGNITVSIGFTEIDIHEATTNTLGTADQALYYAKEHGRNQVCGYELLVEQNKINVSHGDSNGSVELF